MAVFRDFSIIDTTNVEVVDTNTKLILRIVKDAACAFTVKFTDKIITEDETTLPYAKQVGLLDDVPADPSAPANWEGTSDVLGITGLDITSTANPEPDPASAAAEQELVFEGTPTILVEEQELYLAGLGYNDLWYYTNIGLNTISPYKKIVVQVVNDRPTLNIGNPDEVTVTDLSAGIFKQKYLPGNTPEGYTFTTTNGNAPIVWSIPETSQIPYLTLTPSVDTLSATLAGKFADRVIYDDLGLVSSDDALGHVGDCPFELWVSDAVYTTPVKYQFNIPFTLINYPLGLFPNTPTLFSSPTRLIPTNVEYDSRVSGEVPLTVGVMGSIDTTWKVNNTTLSTSVSIGNGMSVYLDGTSNSIYLKGTPLDTLNGKSLTFQVYAIDNTTDENTEVVTYSLYFKDFNFSIIPTTLAEINTGVAFDLTEIKHAGIKIRNSVNSISWSLSDYTDWPPGLKLIKKTDTGTYLDSTHLTPIVFTADTDYLAMYGTATGDRSTPYSFSLIATFTEGTYIKQIKRNFKLKMTAMGVLALSPPTNIILAEVNKYDNTRLFPNVIKASGSEFYNWTIGTFYPETTTGITLVDAVASETATIATSAGTLAYSNITAGTIKITPEDGLQSGYDTAGTITVAGTTTFTGTGPVEDAEFTGTYTVGHTERTIDVVITKEGTGPESASENVTTTANAGNLTYPFITAGTIKITPENGLQSGFDTAGTITVAGTTSFTGTGPVTDAAFSGSYSGTARTIEVVITKAGTGVTPDAAEFKWREGAGSWTTGVEVTGSAQTLGATGVSITFVKDPNPTYGYTLDDTWTYNTPYTVTVNLTNGSFTSTNLANSANNAVIYDYTDKAEFKWREGAGSWTTGVVVTGGAQSLTTTGMSITFVKNPNPTYGYTLDDTWTYNTPYTVTVNLTTGEFTTTHLADSIAAAFLYAYNGSNSPVLSIEQQKTTGSAGYVYFNVTVEGTDTVPTTITNRYGIKIYNTPLRLLLSGNENFHFLTGANYHTTAFYINHLDYTLETSQTLTYDLTDFANWPPGLKLIKNADTGTFLNDSTNTPLVFTSNTDKLKLYGTVGAADADPYSFTLRCVLKEDGNTISTTTQEYLVYISA